MARGSPPVLYARIRACCPVVRSLPVEHEGIETANLRLEPTRRGFCPSCMGRRMSDTAERLVDQVYPRVPVRQWVPSLPIEIRYRLGHDGALLGALPHPFPEHLNAFCGVRVRGLGHDHGRPRGLAFVQLFGSSLHLNPMGRMCRHARRNLAARFSPRLVLGY
jgi:hypothetical protein